MENRVNPMKVSLPTSLFDGVIGNYEDSIVIVLFVYLSLCMFVLLQWEHYYLFIMFS